MNTKENLPQSGDYVESRSTLVPEKHSDPKPVDDPVNTAELVKENTDEPAISTTPVEVPTDDPKKPMTVGQIQVILQGLTNLDTKEKISDIVFFQQYLSDNGMDLDVERVWAPERVFNSPTEQLNYLAAALVLYGLTTKYPEEIWDDDINFDTMQIPPEPFSEVMNRRYPGLLIIAKKINTLSEQLTAYKLFAARRELDSHISLTTNLSEMLTWFFVKKYYRYNAKIWMKYLDSLKDDPANSYQIRPGTDTEIHTTYGEGYSITIQGEGHNTCDDCSGVLQLADGAAVLAFSADGVGSSPLSRKGSEAAGKALGACLTPLLHYSKQNTSLILQYFYTDFSKDLCREWERVLAEEYVPKGESLDLADYQTTLLFTFVYSELAVCGIIGDGLFVVEKVEKSGESLQRGYFRLTDGISGITSGSIQHLSYLKRNPHALKLQVFDASEVSSILMTSDGANGLLYEDIDGCLVNADTIMNAVPYIRKLQELPDSKRKTCIENRAARFSRSNNTAGGMADDCSIVFLNFPKNREQKNSREYR